MEKYFYGFKPKYVPEEAMHLYVTNLLTSLMTSGMNNFNKPKYIKHLKKMLEEKSGDEYEIIKATIYILENE